MKKRAWMFVAFLLTVVGCGKTPHVDQAARPVLKAPSAKSKISEPASAERSAQPATGAEPALVESLPAPASEESPREPEPAPADSSSPSETEPGDAQSATVLQIGGEESQAVIDVANLSDVTLQAIEKLDAAQRNQCLQVFVAELEALPSLNGQVTVSEGKVRFTPRYPLEQGVRYRAVFHPVESDSALTATLEIPKQPVIGTALLEIYPSAEKLPENQLKFYLHFSAPMSRGEAYRHIHLVDVSGKEVDAPFLELGEELWDPTMTRFTLLCDPGRVKRGLKPREEVGPVLEEGKSYSLVIDSAWRDANGNAMASGGGRGIDTLAPDETPVDPETWKLEPPGAGSRDPLVVRFGESLDHAMLERVISVKPAAGEKLGGTIEISENETCWKFTPQEPWAEGSYQLVVATTLEDLAGNSIGRAFEVDEERPFEQKLTSETVTIEFEVAAPATN